MSDAQPETCPECKGDKQFIVHTYDINGRTIRKIEDCLLCAGTGTVHPSLAARYREVKQSKEATQ